MLALNGILRELWHTKKQKHVFYAFECQVVKDIRNEYVPPVDVASQLQLRAIRYHVELPLINRGN